MIGANTGSGSLSYDGDRRAAYLLLDGSEPEIRRVEYDVDRELKALSSCGLPHSDWVAKILVSGRPQMPWLSIPPLARSWGRLSTRGGGGTSRTTPAP